MRERAGFIGRMGTVYDGLLSCCIHMQHLNNFPVRFYVEWGSASVYKDGSHSESKGDFAIKLETLIEAESKTGYLATVNRDIDGEER